MADSKLPFDEEYTDVAKHEKPDNVGTRPETITRIPDEEIISKKHGILSDVQMANPFKRVLSHRTSCFGIQRKKFTILVVLIMLSLLTLIVGLAVGLTQHHAQ